MSRKSNPQNDAVIEFLLNPKKELVRDAHYGNLEQARLDIFKYIETYYNSKRMIPHSAGYPSLSLNSKSLNYLSAFSSPFK